MNRNLSPDERADLDLKQMTLEEKIDLVPGEGMPDWGKPMQHADRENGGAGFFLGVPPRVFP
jgi:beta-glucosidase